jgi:hypothetical protein
MKADWKNNIILEKEKELLQSYRHASADHGLNGNCSFEEPEKLEKMRRLANKHIESSFNFRRLYPMEI